MASTIRFADKALADLRRLDPEARRRIVRYLETRVAPAANPRDLGRPLTGDRIGLWRYRVGDDRIICRITGDGDLVVLVLRVGHRREVYD